MSSKSTEFAAELIREASKFATENFSEDTKRQFKKLMDGNKPLTEEDEAELVSIKAEMGKIYSTSKVCFSPENCMSLDPDLTKIMAESRNSTERLMVWEQWRRNVGQQAKPLYERYMDLLNKKAVLNGYQDLGDQWRSSYETETFKEDIGHLYSEVEPLYRELHAYVRRKLHDTYGGEVVDLRGPLPAHLLGDMWGRFWNNNYDLLEPFKGKQSVDPSQEMEKQNYTALKMFQTANDYYFNMGMKRVPPSFWRLSMLSKPEDGRKVQCHATAWDFYDREDFRVRMCARFGSFEDLRIIHHELGHTQYHMQYKNLPAVYRRGANEGFHEAIGELMALGAVTPKHLHSIGLMDQLEEDQEIDINFMMSQALITISTLPFHLVNDVWRWRISATNISKDDWNTEFWKLKEDIVGVKSPVERTKADLDPPTLYHIIQGWNMMRYFTRTILQFQFFEALCNISGHQGHLHRCDFSGSKKAGEALARMLSQGSSKPWQDVLESLTGERKMSARPILKFFSPLYKWLKKTNTENGDIVGWKFDKTGGFQKY